MFYLQEDTLYIPVLNIARAEFSLRTEVASIYYCVFIRLNFISVYDEKRGLLRRYPLRQFFFYLLLLLLLLCLYVLYYHHYYNINITNTNTPTTTHHYNS